MQTSYRPEVDGLRAVAVLLILLFHFDFSYVPGGYVGVDVFFVISGYLITRNIIRDIQAGTFTFSRFYTRRARRLFPALFVTLVGCVAAAYALLSPPDLEQFGESLLYTVFSASNFYFWWNSGYFDLDSLTKPLLHTWSLGVEEQFYLVWPALILGLCRVKRSGLLPIGLIVTGLCSLALSEGMLTNHPSAAFFLLPFRVFQFCIGALCALPTNRPPKFRPAAELLSLAGLAAIVWSALTFTATTPFPGIAALAPTVGCALVIYSAQATAVGSLLRNGLATGLGKISYSVYLVHWPIVVFYKYWKFTPLDLNERVWLLIASVAVGATMWRWIETPFRSRQIIESDERARVVVGALALVLTFTAANVWGSRGMPWRFPDQYFLRSDQIARERTRYWTAIDNDVNREILQGIPGKGNIVVIGNSHAVDLVYALRLNGSRDNFTFLQSGYRCFNFGSPVTPDDKDYCRDTKESNFSNPALKTADAIYLDDHWPKLDIADLRKTLLRIRSLTDAEIYVFGPKMVFSKDPNEIVRKHMRISSLNLFSQQFALKDERREINDAAKRLVESDEMRAKRIHYIDVLTAQCGADTVACDIISEKTSEFLYFDIGHLTVAGAQELGANLKDEYPLLFK
ncbi:acyltransferase family protein [Pandoraea pnomenusa]|uniref:acyltransferase family protein n=1 Tax=Pandoraea pnomenusa TaxID=93220 RepID=UPI00333FA9C1